jgi:hypothetical protein
VRNAHLHIGEFHGSELMMANFMRTYQDPSFREAHRTMAEVTPAAIVEWLKRRGTFKMPPVAKPWTLRLASVTALPGATFAVSLASPS